MKLRLSPCSIDFSNGETPTFPPFAFCETGEARVFLFGLLSTWFGLPLRLPTIVNGFYKKKTKTDKAFPLLNFPKGDLIKGIKTMSVLLSWNTNLYSPCNSGENMDNFLPALKLANCNTRLCDILNRRNPNWLYQWRKLQRLNTMSSVFLNIHGRLALFLFRKKQTKKKLWL